MSDSDIEEYDVAEQIVRDKLEIQRLTERVASLTQYWRQNDTGTAVLTREGRPDIIVRVSPNSRIDDKLAREQLSAQDYKRVVKSSIDTTKARALLSPEAISRITKNYDHKVEVSLA